MMWKKWMLITGCASGLLFASQLPEVWAQQGRTNGRSNTQPPRRDHSKRQLGALWNGVWRLEASMAPLSQTQARRIVAVVRPWSSKSSMTDAEAKSLVSSINGVLTAAQKSVVGDLNDDGPRSGPPGRNAASMKLLETLNPFYAPTGYSSFKSLTARMQSQLLHRYQEGRATLITLSRKAG